MRAAQSHYAIAAKEQIHVPAIVWMGKDFDYPTDQLKHFKDYPFVIMMCFVPC